jgi:Zinc finger, C2H2 type
MSDNENILDKKNKFHICNVCNSFFSTKQDLRRHQQRKNKCTPINESENKYKCEICGKKFDQKSHYNRHINRKTQCQPETINISREDFETMKNDMGQLEIIKNDIEQLKMNKINNHLTITKGPDINDINSNNTNATNAHNTNSHNTQNIGDNSNNTNNTNNTNTLNNMSGACLIQYVVNNYPNAKNIEDCIKIENIPKMTLEECEDLYFTDGAMKIFKGLCDLGEENRPIHCTDASRGNYIYKSNDVWKIDVGGEAIRDHFFPVIQEAYTQVHKKRIKNNPGNSTVIGNFLTEMTGTNVKKICQKTLKRLSNSFFAKNSKNSRLMQIQDRK